jgi:hypothetical protein
MTGRRKKTVSRMGSSAYGEPRARRQKTKVILEIHG